MHNDSIETLLLRHYGSNTPAPVDLEAHLLASVSREAAGIDEHSQIAINLRERPVSRRRAVRLVALSTAGLGAVSLGLEGLRLIEAALIGQDTTKPAFT